MNTLRQFSLLVFCMLLIGGCRKDDLSQEGSPTFSTTNSEESIQRVFEDQYPRDKLRGLHPHGTFDYSRIEVIWDKALSDMPYDSIVVTAFPISLYDFRLPVSQTFERKDIDNRQGVVSIPRLYHYRDLRTNKEHFSIVIIQPTKDWLGKHNINSIYQQLQVPSDFEGLLDVYSVDKIPQERYVSDKGRAIAHYRAKTHKSSDLRAWKEVCEWRVVGHHFEYSSDRELTEAGWAFVRVATRVDDYAYMCESIWESIVPNFPWDDAPPSDDPDDPRHEAIYFPNMGNFIIGPTKEELHRQRLSKACDEMKNLLSNQDKLSQKIDELHRFRQSTPAKDSYERGYAELVDGTFVALKAINKSRLDPKLTAEQNPRELKTKGFIHNHSKDRVLEDGRIESHIQMFSPGDIQTYLSALSIFYRQGTIDSLELYSILVSEKYIYKLSFSKASREEFNEAYSRAYKNLGQLKANYEKVIMNGDYLDLDNLYEKMVEVFEKTFTIEGLTFQRLNIETKEVRTTGFVSLEGPKQTDQGNSKPSISITPTKIDKITTDC